MTTSSQSKSTTSLIFAILPPELLHQIIQYLEYQDLKALRLTCNFTLEIINLQLLLKSRIEFIQILLDKERTEYERHIHDGSADDDVLADQPPTTFQKLTCYTCLQEKSMERFSRRQRSARRSFGHQNAMKRFCRDCGSAKLKKRRIGYPYDGKAGRSVIMVGDREEAESSTTTTTTITNVNPHWTSLLEQQSPHHGPSINTKVRAGRCQRCWAISHTEREAVLNHTSGTMEPLCKNCFEQIGLLPSVS